MIVAEREGSGPPLILIHGLTDSRRSWDPLVGPLRARFDVVAVDLRGHGESADVGPYDPMTFASDVHDVLEAEDLEPGPLVVGHSLGGLVATAYAAMFPCAGVINIDQPLDLGPFREMLRTYADQLGDDDQLEPTMATMFASMRGVLGDEEWNRLAAHRRVNHDAVRAIWSPILDLEADELDRSIVALAESVHVAYLAVHGSAVPAGYDQWLARHLPSARLIEWPGVGHLAHLVDPGRFVELVGRFAEAARSTGDWRETFDALG